jgi:predicted ferric reductase
MDIPQIYAVSLGCLLLLYIIIYILSSIANVRIYGTVYFFKYLYYPQVPQFIGYPRQTTWFEVAILIAFLVGNATCMALNVDGISGFIKRSGLICTINIIPLALGAQMNLAVDSCNMKLTTYGRIHRWLGRVTIIEGLIHAVAAVLFYGHDLLARADVAALITVSTFISYRGRSPCLQAQASIAILAILFSGLLRRHVYEVYINLHQLLAVLIVSATYFHMTRRKLFEFPTIYLLAAVCLQIIVGAMRFGQVLYRNFKHRKPLNRALVQTIIYKRGSKRAIPVSDAVHVHIRLTRPWKPQAGQYVYLSIPGVSSTSFAQSHPFYVSWWYNDVAGANIVLIIQKRKGFTKDLFLHADKYINSGYEMRSGIGSENDIGSNIEDDSEMELFIGDRFKMRAIVEGPYGKELQLDSYGTVLLFATGIGIAGQLPYITRLLEGYRNCEVKTRRIALFWEVESECKHSPISGSANHWNSAHGLGGKTNEEAPERGYR